MTSQEPIGAGKPVFIEHEQNQEGSGVGGAARIKYRSGEEYIRADIAEQMAKALEEIGDKTDDGAAMRTARRTLDAYREAINVDND